MVRDSRCRLVGRLVAVMVLLAVAWGGRSAKAQDDYADVTALLPAVGINRGDGPVPVKEDAKPMARILLSKAINNPQGKVDGPPIAAVVVGWDGFATQYLHWAL